MIHLRLVCLVLCACSSTPRADWVAEDAATLVGTWTTSVESYDDAERATDAVELTDDGIFRLGTWTAAGFVAAPGVGPSGEDFVVRYVLEPASHTLVALLDGAEERATYHIDGPDRWRTHSGPPYDVTIFYVRRAAAR